MIREFFRELKNPWLALAVAAMLGMILLFWLMPIGQLHARDLDGRYDNSPNREWFRSQRNSAGMWCCDEADGHQYFGDYKINEDGSVTVEGQTIESYKVLKDANPTGAAVWWYVDGAYGRTTYCFSPGSLT